jgi:hypothetical protein
MALPYNNNTLAIHCIPIPTLTASFPGKFTEINLRDTRDPKPPIKKMKTNLTGREP